MQRLAAQVVGRGGLLASGSGERVAGRKRTASSAVQPVVNVVRHPWLALLLLCHLAPAWGEVKIGVFERIEGRETAEEQVVRALFYRSQAGWRAYPHEASNVQELAALPARYPKRVSWNITLQGRPVGSLQATGATEFKSYSAVGTMRFTDVVGDYARLQGPLDSRWRFWARRRAWRPLMLVEGSQSTAGQNWKVQPVGKAQQRAVLRFLGKKYGPLPKAVWHEARVGTGQLVELSFERNLWPARGEGHPTSDQLWIWLRPDGTCSQLGSNMGLLDTGDYDGDGTSEWVFFVSRYNCNGYRLYSGGKLAAEFLWNYH